MLPSGYGATADQPFVLLPNSTPRAPTLAVARPLLGRVEALSRDHSRDHSCRDRRAGARAPSLLEWRKHARRVVPAEAERVGDGRRDVERLLRVGDDVDALDLVDGVL